MIVIAPVELEDLMTQAQIDKLTRGLVEVLASKYGSVKIEVEEGRIRFIYVTRSEDLSGNLQAG